MLCAERYRLRRLSNHFKERLKLCRDIISPRNEEIRRKAEDKTSPSDFFFFFYSGMKFVGGYFILFYLKDEIKYGRRLFSSSPIPAGTLKAFKQKWSPSV